MKVSDLIKKSALDRKTITKIESGTANPFLDTIGKLAVALEVPIRKLFDESANVAKIQAPNGDCRLKLHVRQVRMEKGMTLRELAAKANVATSLLSRIEAETATPLLATMSRLAKALEVPVYDLFSYD